MKQHRKHKSGPPPFIDPAFADALAGDVESGSHYSPKHHYKALQLCRQVRRVLTLSLGIGSGDDLLGQAYVLDVTPAPDATHLLVHVSVPKGASVIELLERLNRVAPALRAEVARAITRKRAPELSFIPVAHGREGEVSP